MPSQIGPVTTRGISLETIREAASTVYEAAVRTPLVRLHLPPRAGTADAADVEIFLKLETLQPIGSFKIRGAYNAITHLSTDELAQGVWTVSAGNAAQGVAFAARSVGAKASVLVMDTAPATKLRAIERLGARIVQAPYDECWRTVEAHRSDRMRGRFVHPFDNDHFFSGNGTIGLEIVDDLPDVDAVVAPLGGGGLLAGV
ncbi:MAG: threonine ammonia-lyase, partial [Vicinamibacterales bacterium]